MTEEYAKDFLLNKCIDHFPRPVAEWIHELSDKRNKQKGYSFLSFLTVSGILLGNDTALKINEEWDIKPRVYGMAVGDIGTSKTPSLKVALKVLKEINKKNWEEYEEAKKNYDLQELLSVKEKRALGDDKIPKPFPSPIFATNVTPETLPDLLARAQGNSFLLLHNELGQLLGFRKGAAYMAHLRDYMIDLFDGEAAIVVRKGDGSVRIPSSCIGLLGGIQPRLLKQQVRDDLGTDGLLERILPVQITNSQPKLSSQQINPKYDLYWRNLAKDLYSSAQNYTPSPGFLSQFTKLVNDTQESVLHGWDKKLVGYVGTFALILYSMDNAGKGNPVIPEKYFHKAMDLHNYFKGEWESLYASSEDDSALSEQPDKFQDGYAKLPIEFSRGEAVAIFTELGWSASTVDTWLTRSKKMEDIFRKVDQGRYKKLI